MTPFGLLLRYMRNERGVALKTISSMLGVRTAVMSAIETGRRGPPTKEQIFTLKTVLKLNDKEFASLIEAARVSETHVRIPYNARPIEYRLVHQLIGRIGSLSDQQVADIQVIVNSFSGIAQDG